MTWQVIEVHVHVVMSVHNILIIILTIRNLWICTYLQVCIVSQKLTNTFTTTYISVKVQLHPHLIDWNAVKIIISPTPMKKRMVCTQNLLAEMVVEHITDLVILG